MAKKTPLLLIIAAVWTLPLIFTMTPGFGWNYLLDSPSAPSFWCIPRLMITGSFVQALLRGFMYPCFSTLVGANLRIIYQAKKNAMKIQDTRWACSRGQQGHDNNQSQLNNYKAGRKSTISLIFIVLIIVFCWSPLIIMMEMTLEPPGSPEQSLKTMAILISVISFSLSLSSLGPLTYILRHAEFREGIKHVFLKIKFWQ
ncbi:uncharacterized protein LOC144450547 [Glandiceps talaboti]